VPLGEELALLDHFVALVNLRYAGALRVSVTVDRAAAEAWTIPPVVLPELLENAVKHNQLTAEDPLDLEIRLDSDRLTVSNPVRPRFGTVDSTGVGLHNLARRFRLAAGTAARWGVVDGRFVVTLPLVGAGGAGGAG
jgi:LytS/YehU family sensor histidine kinase